MSMKRQRYTEIIVILSSLFIVGGTISFLYDTKKEVNTTQTNIDASVGVENTEQDNNLLLPPPPVMQVEEQADQTEAVIVQDINHLRKYVNPLIAANNILEVAHIMRGNPADFIAKQAELLIDGKGILLRHESKVQLILALANNYDTLQEESTIFNIFLINKQFFIDSKNSPILFVAASPLYAMVIPDLLAWAKNSENIYAGLHKKIINDGLKYAITHNGVAQLNLMLENGAPVGPAKATELLWSVVSQNKSAQFIPLLKKCGANLEDVENKKTVLIQAIINNNKEMAQALLDAGASITTIPDSATGSPLQQALLNKRTEIELLLRKRGARE